MSGSCLPFMLDIDMSDVSQHVFPDYDSGWIGR